MMNQVPLYLPRPESLLQCIERKLGAHTCRRTPADDHPRENVDDEGDICSSLPRRHVSKVGNTKPIGPIRVELSVHEIEGPRIAIRRDGSALDLAPYNATEAHRTH